MLDKITFSVSTYEGYEEEVLKVLNRNRDGERTREYLDWRYLGERRFRSSPLVFWAYQKGRGPVGMAGLIPRPYWINGKLRKMWVLGDISVDKDLRGKGIGKKLLEFLTHYARDNSLTPLFVIPNKRVKKILLMLGWHQPMQFDWYVWIVNPFWRGNKTLRDVGGRIWRKLNMIRIKKLPYKSNIKLSISNHLDVSFNELWNSIPKNGVVIRDRGQQSLKWRFEKNPRVAYHIERFTDESRLIGYIVYTLEDNGTCRIADFLVDNIRSLKPMMSIFLTKFVSKHSARIVRIKINENRTYGERLRELGFIKRTGEDVFQICDLIESSSLISYNWYLTVADKDT